MAPPRPTVIRRGRLLDGATRKGELADILIEDDTILEIGPPGLDAPEAATTLDATDRLLIPGLVNAHTHGDTSFAKGHGQAYTLELLLNAVPAVGLGRRPEDKHLAARLAAVEMLSKGCTACYDLFSELPGPTAEGLEAVATAYRDVGMRAVVAPLMADRTFWQAIPGMIEALPPDLRREVERIRAQPGAAQLEVCTSALEKWPVDWDQVRLALAPTIPHHCDDAFFRACRQLADEHGLGIQTHLAESKVQAVVGLRKYGKTLAAHLDGLGIVAPDFTAAHAVWLDDEDIRRLADRGASVAHNPTSNLRLGVGVARTRAMLDAGLNVGVGTDGSTCSDGLNMFEAMRLACHVSRIQSPDPADWLTAEQALAMATQGSATALGFGALIGALEPGRKADMVFIDLAHVNYVPLNDPAAQLVLLEHGGAVDKVMVGGRLVVDGGRVLTVDLPALRAEVEHAVDRLRTDAADARDLTARLEPIVGSFCVGLAREPYHLQRYVGA
jgi:5-methylthioadenosine/S-adenosylhomocysteine deaminase